VRQAGIDPGRADIPIFDATTSTACRVGWPRRALMVPGVLIGGHGDTITVRLPGGVRFGSAPGR